MRLNEKMDSTRTDTVRTHRWRALYILHPLRVMLKMKTDEQRMAAVLHDVVEETDWTIDRFRAAGFSATVLAAVESLTHAANESYEDFVRRAAADREPFADRDSRISGRECQIKKAGEGVHRIEVHRRVLPQLTNAN